MRGALRRFWRSIKSDPWYGVSVVVTIGLGIGISTSAFTVLGTQIEISLMSESFEDLIGQWVRSARLLTLFALLAGLVTFVGIYGSMTYDLMRRRRELGIRMALGARPAQLTRDVVKTGLRWSGYGLMIGAVGAFWLAMAVRALLFGTTPWDLGSLAVSVVMVLGIGGLAAWLGARRAVVKDPVFLLRNAR